MKYEPVILKTSDKEIETYAFLDEGSSAAIMVADFAAKAELHMGKTDRLKFLGQPTKVNNTS